MRSKRGMRLPKNQEMHLSETERPHSAMPSVGLVLCGDENSGRKAGLAADEKIGYNRLFVSDWTFAEIVSDTKHKRLA